MVKVFIILVFAFGLIGYVGVFSFQKIISIAFASGTVNYYEGAEKATPTSIMTLKSCSGGDIPFLRSYQGDIEISPRDARLEINRRLRIVNGDTVPHTIGIAFTKFWEVVDPGDALQVTYDKLPKPGIWGITCDGINLGDKAPTIVVPEL